MMAGAMNGGPRRSWRSAAVSAVVIAGGLLVSHRHNNVSFPDAAGVWRITEIANAPQYFDNYMWVGREMRLGAHGVLAIGDYPTMLMARANCGNGCYALHEKFVNTHFTQYSKYTLKLAESGRSLTIDGFADFRLVAVRMP